MSLIHIDSFKCFLLLQFVINWLFITLTFSHSLGCIVSHKFFIIILFKNLKFILNVKRCKNYIHIKYH